MQARHLPVWRLVALSWSDVWRALRAMPLLFGCAVLIVLAVHVGEELLPGKRWNGAVFGTLADVLENTVQYFCLTPVMMAIHRFIIRGDITRSYVIDLTEPDFLLFFAWVMAISILYSLVFGFNEALMENAAAAGHPSFAAFIGLIVALIVSIWFSMRIIVLLPAIAVGASGAGPANAFADTKGYDLRLLAIFSLAFMPMLALAIPATIALGNEMMRHRGGASVLPDIVFAFFGTAAEALGVVIASHIYLAIGRRIYG
jgi:hypothetical protein